MKIKVSEASGPVLDWMVGLCEGVEFTDSHTGIWFSPWGGMVPYCPSDDWEQGGPVIDGQGISIIFHGQGNWTASNLHGTVCEEGPTPLIAAMRAYVFSKLGDEVEVPGELKGKT